MSGDVLYILGTMVQIVGFFSGMHVRMLGACLTFYGASIWLASYWGLIR